MSCVAHLIGSEDSRLENIWLSVDSALSALTLLTTGYSVPIQWTYRRESMGSRYVFELHF